VAIMYRLQPQKLVALFTISRGGGKGEGIIGQI
jgi:hypothetical protein